MTMDWLSPDLLQAHPEWTGQQAATPLPAGTTSNGQMPAPQQQPPANYGNPTPGAYSGYGNPTPAPDSGYTGSFGYEATPAAPAPAPSVGNGAAATNQWQATKDLLNAREFEVQANVKTLPLKNDVLKAQEGVLAKQEADIGANRNYLSEQLRANDARRAEAQAIQAANNDPNDIKNTARATREQDNEDYLFQLAGMPAPLRVKMPAGYTGTMPPGTLIAVQTLADILTDKSKDAEEMRKFNIEAARIKSANTGLDVTAAQIAKGRVELTLDEAQLAAEAAGWTTSQMSINADRAKLPPGPGLVLDDSTGEWTTPSQAYINESLARDKAKNAILGTFGSIPADTLMSMATQDPPTITDSQLREGLIAQGVSPSSADEYVKLAAARRAAKKAEDDLAAEWEARRTGTTTPPAAATTTTSGGAVTGAAAGIAAGGNSGGTTFR